MNQSQMLPRFSLPMAVGGTYRAFEIGDDHMLPVTPGTTIVARYLTEWHTLTPNAPHIVVSQKDGIQFRRISLEGECFMLASDNPLYATARLPLYEVLELWEAKAYISNYMPPSAVTLESVAELARDLTRQVQALQINRA